MHDVRRGRLNFDWVQVISCPVCGAESSHFQGFERLEIEPGVVLDYSICEKCGCVFQSPRMTEESLASFYEREYRRQVQGSEGPTSKDIYIQQERAKHLMHFLKKHVDGVLMHLDVGASTGALMEATARDLGCKAIGIEPGLAYREYAASRGLEVYPDVESLPSEFRGRFDMVSLIHVLEHIPEPGKYLARLRTMWMTDGGWLLLEVPNLFGHMSLELAHLIAFSKDTVCRTLSNSGFNPAEIILHGRPRSPLLKLYISVLARADGVPGPSVEREVNVSRLRGKRRLANRIRGLSTRWIPWLIWRALPEGVMPRHAESGRPPS